MRRSAPVSRRIFMGLALCAAAFATTGGETIAADYPSRPITLIVPWPAGGGTDTQMRLLADIVSKDLGQPITIENKAGGAGTLGPATMAAGAKPDGYTISQMPATVYRLPFVQKTSFDPKKDFTYILQVTGYAFGVAVRNDAPWQNWEEFVAHAKANPGQVSYSSPGAGSTPHLTMEEIARHYGLKLVHVPYKGGAEQNAGLLGGHTVAAAGGTSAFSALADAGQLRMLVVWTRDRLKRFPDAPTLREIGIDKVVTSPYGLAGPAGMDPAVVKILHDAFHKAMQEPAHREFIERTGYTDDYLDTEAYEKFVMQFTDEQEKLVQELGISKK